MHIGTTINIYFLKTKQISIPMDSKKMGDISNLKNGNFVLINGNYEFDAYKKYGTTYGYGCNRI